MKHILRAFPCLILMLAITACTSKSPMDRYIDELMSRMTLEQKIGQLNLHSAPGFISAERVMDNDENAKLLREGQLGGIYGSSNPALMRQYQDIALQSGAGIP